MPARAQRRRRPARARRRRANSPSPISASVRCASGARSPEAPTEPCDGMHGTRPALCAASSVSTTASRTPEWPRARLAAFSASISRTTGGAAARRRRRVCERIRLSCSVASSVGVDARAGELAEAGVDAVDRGVAGRGALHDRGAGADRRARRRRRASSATPPACDRLQRRRASACRAGSRAASGAEHRQVQALLAGAARSRPRSRRRHGA